ncbi:unnamed protein product [Diabrotica balteata]|uniref:Nucleoside diphosphate kinase-like domain-containing protein n=1 Tax=Diabrotica balteata TaxID=107213 RepID=A0A9N9SS39_DIABA|nr:unnamed protein product [Diabrotica balteata]
MSNYKDVQANSRDRIRLLNQESVKTGVPFNLNTQRTHTPLSTTDSSCHSYQAKDTVHYLSPATTPAVTDLEGDIYYQQFADYELPPQADHYGSSSTSTLSCKEPDLQRTLAIVKPDGMKYKDVILRAIKGAGIKMLQERIVHLSPEQVSEIYAKQYGTPSFPHVVISVSISPILVLSLAGKNVVEKWKTMVGPYGLLREEWFFPYSIRTRFGIQSDVPDVLHASENITEAKWENRYFFPRNILEPIPIYEEKVSDYIQNRIASLLMEGLVNVVKNKPVDPVLYLAEWLLLNNPYQPKFPEKIALSPL